MRPALTCKYATKKRPCASLFPVCAMPCDETARFGLQYGLFQEPKRAVLQSKTARSATH